MRREDLLLNMRNVRLDRQVDEDWEKPDPEWPEFISIWWGRVGEELYGRLYFPNMATILAPYALPDSIKR